jgi:hypothetical protein
MLRIQNTKRTFITLCALIFAAAALSFPLRSVAAETDPSVDFRWAFAALTDRGQKAQPITRDTALKSGDRLKIMIELTRPCFVYVFHFNERDGLTLLFPYSFQQFSADYRVRRKYYVPRDEAWLQLDQSKGEEVFHLLASGQRLNDLEDAYGAYEAAPAGDPARKAEAAGKVIELIRAIRKQHREFTSPAERPVAIGGAVRELVPVQDPARFDIDGLADAIISPGLVARTFTIEHR